MDGTKKEEVLARNDELKEENEQLKKLVHLTQKRHKKEAEKRDKDLESMAAELEERKKEGDKMREALEREVSLEATDRALLVVSAPSLPAVFYLLWLGSSPAAPTEGEVCSPVMRVRDCWLLPPVILLTAAMSSSLAYFIIK